MQSFEIDLPKVELPELMHNMVVKTIDMRTKLNDKMMSIRGDVKRTF